MLKNNIAAKLRAKLGETPTASQAKAMDALSAYIASPAEQSVFLLTGYAGTGKTTLIRALVQALSGMDFPVMLLAPTGRAAKVMSAYSGYPAYTIHKKVFRQKTAQHGLGVFDLGFNKFSNMFFIVDEASMIANQQAGKAQFGSGRLLEDLLEFVFSGKRCKLILVGDTAQLPPVHFDQSPALDPKVLKGLPQVRELAGAHVRDVVRQAFNSGILYNATRLRNLLPQYQPGSYPKFKTEGFPDFEALTGNELLDALNDAYDTKGMEETIVICRSNKQANRYNQGIRNAILWREEEISVGDQLMVVKNNYYWLKDQEGSFIANGDIGQVSYIHGFQELYGLRFADVSMVFPDYDEREIDVKIILDTLHKDTPALPQDDFRKFYETVREDYPEIRNQKKLLEKLREHPHFNALQVKFAYAITGHKAQGGQWGTVFIDQGFLPGDHMQADYIRWLYTSLTRAREQLYLINFKKDFFEADPYLY